MNAEDMNDVSHDHPSEIGWGTPAPAGPPTVPGPSPSGAWVTVRTITLAVLLVLGVLGVGAGVVLVVSDLSDPENDWFGLLLALGAAVGAVGLVVAGLAGLALRAMRRHGPSGGRILTGLLGGLLALLVLVSPGFPVLVLPGALGILLLVTLVVDRPERRA